MGNLTKKQVEAFLKDINKVCQKHGIGMVGGCYSEGIDSEIEFRTLNELVNEFKERSEEIERGELSHNTYYYVEKIGKGAIED